MSDNPETRPWYGDALRHATALHDLRHRPPEQVGYSGILGRLCRFAAEVEATTLPGIEDPAAFKEAVSALEGAVRDCLVFRAYDEEMNTLRDALGNLHAVMPRETP